MRIVFLAPELFSIGGIQRQNRLVIAALDELVTRAGGRLRVLALNDPAPVDWGPELGALQSTSIASFGKRRLAFVRQALSESRQADLVIYGLVGFVPIALGEALLGHANRRLLMLYGIEAWAYRSPLHALALRYLHGYIPISQYTLSRFCAAYSLNGSQPSFILPNAVSSRLRENIEVYPANADDPPRLLTVSRLTTHEQYKGIDAVIRAMPALVKQFPNLRYTIIGDGTDRLRLERIARDLQVEPQIDFMGYISDEALKKTYRDCTVFVLPSAEEGFGFVFIEAMAYGKPVVAARAGAAPEVVCDGETGLLVEYGHVPELVKAIATLINQPDLRRKMGQAGIEAVRARFAYDSLKANLSGILEANSLPVSLR